MNERDDYWQRVTRELGRDGPAEVPRDLAARAFDAALAAEHTRAPSLLDTLLALARPVTAAAVVAAGALLAVGLTTDAPARDASTARSPSVYEALVGDRDADPLAELLSGAES